jgi:hypothetical protein
MQKPQVGEYYSIDDLSFSVIIIVKSIHPQDDRIVFYDEIIEDDTNCYYNTDKIWHWKKFKCRKLTPLEIELL